MYGSNMIGNGYYNPFMPQIQPQQAARQEVTRVNGYNGASAFEIGANSSALLLDTSGLMVWLVTTDGAGYKTVQPYDITPHKDAPAPDYAALEERISKLEGMMKNGNTGNSATAKQLTIPDDE